MEDQEGDPWYEKPLPKKARCLPEDVIEVYRELQTAHDESRRG
jgi:hypothetical protein